MMARCTFAAGVFWLNSVATAFYIPGTAPNAYDPGARVPVQANKLESSKTQVPYGYYSLDYCPPERIEIAEANLGQILHGDLIQNTPYEVHMNMDDPCIKLCERRLTNDSLAAFKGMIDDEYYVNLYADDLPAALVLRPTPGQQTNDPNFRPDVVVSGFPVGYKVAESANGSTASANQQVTHYYLVNHLDMTLYWHPTDEGNRVVGFEIEPKTKAYNPSATELKCEDGLAPLDLATLAENQTVIFTYSVTWQFSTVSWATRWDSYLRASAGTEQIYWFSLLNSFGVVVILSTVVAMILVRTLVRDITRYNNLEDIEEAQEESGWKLIHGDVFRRPNFSKLLATCTGTGIQVLIMGGLTLGFSLLGVLSPANRGALLQAMLILFAFMGGPAGYVSARFNKLFQGEDTQRSFIVTLWTAFQYVGVCFTTFLVMNTILWAKGSSGAIQFKWIFLLVVLWLGVSVPLVFVGAYMGYRKPTIIVPCRVNAIPRQIPKPPLMLTTPVVLMAGGILPFGAVFSEVSLIMTSVWQHRFYYLFGFLTLVMVILMITCAEASIVFTYFQLISEDYRWWWRSYWISAFSAVYLAVFCVIYFFEALEISSFASALLYFGYSALMCYTFFIVTGAIGFVSTFWFVRGIYGAIKVD